MTYDEMVAENQTLCEELVAQHDRAVQLGFEPVAGHTEHIEGIRKALEAIRDAG